MQLANSRVCVESRTRLENPGKQVNNIHGYYRAHCANLSVMTSSKLNPYNSW